MKASILLAICVVFAIGVSASPSIEPRVPMQKGIPQHWRRPMPTPVGAAADVVEATAEATWAQPMPSPMKVSAVGTALPQCTTSSTTVVNETSGQYGCMGNIVRYITQTFIFSADKARQFKMQIWGYSDSTLTIYYSNQFIRQIAPGTAGVSIYFPAGSVTKVEYYSGAYTTSTTGYGATIDITEGVATIAVASGQTYNLQKSQQGGFVYFSLPYYAKGRLFALTVDVFSYQGLQEPSVFVSVNRVPTLESFDYTNTTVTVGDKERAILFQADPKDGVFVIGVFLYGSAARLAVTPQWTFNFIPLQSGVRVASTVSNIDYYQLTVPVNATALKFQISRQVPGGYPVAYIAAGTLPSSTNYGWIADTSVQSYISLTINDPNPIANLLPNPGNYIIAIAGSGGYIIQCDW